MSEPAKLKPAPPAYVLDVVARQPVAARIGARAWVRLDFGNSPGAAQLSRWLRQLISSDAVAQIS